MSGVTVMTILCMCGDNTLAYAASLLLQSRYGLDADALREICAQLMSPDDTPAPAAEPAVTALPMAINTAPQPGVISETPPEPSLVCFAMQQCLSKCAHACAITPHSQSSPLCRAELFDCLQTDICTTAMQPAPKQQQMSQRPKRIITIVSCSVLFLMWQPCRPEPAPARVGQSRCHGHA